MSWSRESIFLVLLFLFLKLKTVLEQHCDLLIDDRSECGFPGIEKIQCEERNCCWIPFALNDIRNPPWCSEPANKSCGYKQITPTTLQDRCNSTRFANISVQYIGTSILRVSITRSFNEFTVPSSLFPNEANESSFTSELRFESFNDDFGNFNFKIIRLKDSSIIWDTNLPGNNSMSSIQMKNQYTQIGSRIPKNHNIYGLGYHAGPLKIPEGARLALYSRDAPSLPSQNLYSAHPFYLQLQNGTAHGVVSLFYFKESYS
jgi:alpha-glucosidase (family GH31 glycosyl hydrolase)